jgi:hypothetical protein
MWNELIYYVDPKHVMDHLEEGKILRVRVWGPKREYLQVAIADRPPPAQNVKKPELVVDNEAQGDDSAQDDNPA